MVCAVDRPTKFVRFSMTGVLKIVCHPEHHDPLVVRYLAPRSFFCVPTLEPHCGYRIALVAHERGLVALIGYRDFRHAATALHGKAIDLASWTFRTVSRWLYHKTVLLRCSVPERLLYELSTLARELPVTANDDEVEIGARITHDDLAALIGATRAPVTHALRALGEAGLVRQPSMGRLLVSKTLLQSSPADVARRLRATLR